jgi:hypothetical protein
VSFLDRAKQAAQQAADSAKQAAEQARQAATEGATKAQAVMSDPETANKARNALTKAKRGLSTAIDKIDPNVLADVVIKATALQEKANMALKAKGSPYRISEIGIGAAIPPSVTFSISRTDDPDAEIVPVGSISSTALEATVMSDPNLVQALDGTQIEEAALVEEAV